MNPTDHQPQRRPRRKLRRLAHGQRRRAAAGRLAAPTSPAACTRATRCVMRETVRLAIANGVSLGAHPAFPDLQGFGRRVMQLSRQDLEATILYQVGALQAMAAAEGGRVTHVKPHGALNNIACADAGGGRHRGARRAGAGPRTDPAGARPSRRWSKRAKRPACAWRREVFADRDLPGRRPADAALAARRRAARRRRPACTMCCACSTRRASSPPTASACPPAFTASACTATAPRPWPRRGRSAWRWRRRVTGSHR